MQMRNFALFAILAIGIALTGSEMAAAQAPTRQHHLKTFGYQDADGVFHAAHAAVEVANTAETLTGTLEVTFNITVKSAFPKGYVLFCEAGFSISSVNETAPTTSEIVYEESGETTTTTTSCTVNIPYSWVVNAPASTVINSLAGSYSVFAINPTVTGFASTEELRLVGGTIVNSSTFPANGAITKYTIAVTI